MRESSKLSIFAGPIAHRGLHKEIVNCIENTESAFQAAIKNGYAIECDVRLSADNKVIVFHDESLERLTNSTGLVHQLTVAELKDISFKKSTDKVQTLNELLQQVDGVVPIIIEMKSRGNGDVGLALNVATELLTYIGPVATMSFDPILVAAAQKWMPWLPNGIVAENMLTKHGGKNLNWVQKLNLSWFLHWPKTRPDFISYCIEDLPSWPLWLIKRITKKPIISWTIKSIEQANKSQKYCDQITFEGFDPE